MFKLYEKTKNYIKENYKVMLFFLFIFIIFFVRLPYYVSAPGGIINTKEKIDISSSFKLKGSLNMAYVSQLEGNIPILLYALINPDWDIESEDEVTVGNEDIRDEEYRNKMLLKEANDISILVAYENSSVSYTTSNNKVYVTYVDDMAKTNLKIKDRIIKIGDKSISSKQNLYDEIKKHKPKEKIEFTVLRDGKKVKCRASLLDINGETKVGVLITETFDIKSDYHVDLNFKSSESGSSGGLMMTLTIYSYLNKVDLTGGKKIVGTGTIDRDGTVGEISGVKYKLIGAVSKDADVFLVPQGENYVEARNLKNKNGYDIDIIPIETFDDALKYLKSNVK